MPPSKHRPVVILSTANFESAVWTNKQHLAVGLAATRDVYYVESLGLRRPTLRRADLVRILRRLRRRVPSETTAARAMPPRLSIVRPTVVPFHGNSIIRRLNRALLDRFTFKNLPNDAVIWTFSPLTYGLEDRYPTVYHSVDFLHTLPAVPAKTLLGSERRLVNSAARLVASSAAIRSHLEQLGGHSVNLWENVAQTELFASRSGERRESAVFAGNFTPTKIDVGLLARLLEEGVPLELAGPVAIDGTQPPPDLEAVLSHPLCNYHGLLPLDELADLVATCKVGLIPYSVNAHTAGIFPMKVYEYLAGGLQVISTPLESLWRPIEGVKIARGEAFVSAVKDALSTWSESVAQTSRDSASDHSWSNRITTAQTLLEALEVEVDDLR